MPKELVTVASGIATAAATEATLFASNQVFRAQALDVTLPNADRNAAGLRYLTTSLPQGSDALVAGIGLGAAALSTGERAINRPNHPAETAVVELSLVTAPHLLLSILTHAQYATAAEWAVLGVTGVISLVEAVRIARNIVNFAHGAYISPAEENTGTAATQKLIANDKYPRMPRPKPGVANNIKRASKEFYMKAANGPKVHEELTKKDQAARVEHKNRIRLF